MYFLVCSLCLEVEAVLTYLRSSRQSIEKVRHQQVIYVLWSRQLARNQKEKKHYVTCESFTSPLILS